MRKICSQRLLQHYERTSSRISTGSPQDLLSKIPSQKKIIQQECFYLSFLKGHDGTNGPNGPNGLNGLNGPLRARLTGSTGSTGPTGRTGPTQQRTMAYFSEGWPNHQPGELYVNLIWLILLILSLLFHQPDKHLLFLLALFVACFAAQLLARFATFAVSWIWAAATCHGSSARQMSERKQRVRRTIKSMGIFPFSMGFFHGDFPWDVVNLEFSKYFMWIPS